MDGLSHYTQDSRPWGGFEQFTFNEQSTVKIITVKHGEAFSLQTHAEREEFWRVLSGFGTVTLDDKQLPAKVGDSFFVPRGTAHRAEANTEDLVLLEIAFGTFDENDITRLEDRYGRV